MVHVDQRNKSPTIAEDTIREFGLVRVIHFIEHDLIEFDIVLFEQFLGFGAVGTIGRRENSRLLLTKEL